MDWLWIGGSNQFALWIDVRVSDLVYRTGETIYSAEHLHETQNKITEDINEKNKPNLTLHGWNSFLKAWNDKICSSAVSEKSDWKTGIAN